MDRKHLHLVVTDQPVHNAVRPADELTHLRVFELWNRPARFRKNLELPNSRDELTHGDRGVVCGVLADEGVNGSEVGGPGRSRGWFSRGEPLLHLVMRNELARIGLPESLLDLRDEAQSLNRVLNRRWLGEALDGVDGPLLLRCFHGQIPAPSAGLPCSVVSLRFVSL